MKDDLEEIFNLAKEIAFNGALVHQKGLKKVISAETKSSELELVTNIDFETEEVIVGQILKKRPNDSIVSEEGNNHLGFSGVSWIIDPLDGTVNYLHRYPAFGISIGVEIDNAGTIGVVFDTYNEQLYSGIVGKKATCYDEIISVSNCSSLKNALIATGFLPDQEIRIYQGKILTDILPNVRDIRRSGSPIIDLCRVASGVLDGFYEFGLKKWDFSAGSTIAKAAGAKVSILSIDNIEMSPLIVASAPGIHNKLLEMVLESLENTERFYEIRKS